MRYRRWATSQMCSIFPEAQPKGERPWGGLRGKAADGCKADWTNTQCLPRRGEEPRGGSESTSWEEDGVKTKTPRCA